MPKTIHTTILAVLIISALVLIPGCSDTAQTQTNKTNETDELVKSSEAIPAAIESQATEVEEPAQSSNVAPPLVKLQTNLGDILILLDKEAAPLSVANFIQYVEDDYYDGTIFHRVIKNFMIQGGGFTPDYRKKTTRDPIVNESKNGLRNLRGTIAMARTNAPNSATSQFFINHKDNSALDYPRNGGYAVFGRVVEGMDIVDAIAEIPTGRGGPFQSDVPVKPVIIQYAEIVK